MSERGRRLRCRLRTAWGTLTMAAFWRSLVAPPLVVYSGHSWPYPPTWGSPAPSPYPEAWDGLVEFDESVCTDCGDADVPRAWRPYLAREPKAATTQEEAR